MKCSVCGNELYEGAKFCRYCGAPVSISEEKTKEEETIKEIEKICPKCGSGISEENKFCNYCGWDLSIPYEETEEPVRKNTKKYLIGGLIAVLAIVILGTAGFFGSRFIKNKMESKRDTVYTTESSEDTYDDSDQFTEAAEEYESVSSEYEETTSLPDSTTEIENKWNPEYVDNASFNVDNNLSINDFERVYSFDGEYYFSYPKYIFNNSSYSNEDGYYLSYEENGNPICYMQVYSEDEPTDDPVALMESKQKELMDSYQGTDFSKNGSAGYGYYFPVNFEEHGIGDDGIMQIVLNGWTDDTKKFRSYVCAGNDGKKTYYLKFVYPDYDIRDDYEELDYIAMSVYRMTSFSGSSKDANKSYEDYLNKERE